MDKTHAFIILPPKNIMFHVKHYIFLLNKKEKRSK